MKLILTKTVIAVLKEVPAVLETLPAGATVEFCSSVRDVDLVEVEYNGKRYNAMVTDLFDASHPAEWLAPSG